MCKNNEQIKVDADVAEANSLYEAMDKYDCDTDVAELMLQDDEEDAVCTK